MVRKHQVHRASFKALRGEGTPSELGLRFGVHPTQVSQWKQQLEKTAQRVSSGEGVERKPSRREKVALAVGGGPRRRRDIGS